MSRSKMKRTHSTNNALQSVFFVFVGLASLALLFSLFYLYSTAQTQATSGVHTYNKLRWISPIESSPLKMAFLAICSILLFGFAQIIANSIRPFWHRFFVVVLRSFSIAFLVIMFIEPSLRLEHVKSTPNTVAVLIDSSLSMTLPLNSETTLHEKSLELIANSKDTTEFLKQKHHFQFFTFGDALVKVTSKDISNVIPEAPMSTLRPALHEIKATYSPQELAGIIVISDGLVEEPEFFKDLSSMDKTSDSPQPPIHTIVNKPSPKVDIAIQRVVTAEFSFVRTVTRIEVELSQSNLSSEAVLPLELYENGRLIRQKTTTLDPKDIITKDFFEVTPPHHGTFLYEIRIGQLEGERTLKNNSNVFSIKAIRDKIRILHVAGRPSWDVRSFRGMLKQNSNVDLVSFFILRTPSDLQLADDNELSLIPFPTRELFEEELQSFDVIILQNFDFMPYSMYRYLGNIKDYVAKGGGLIMVGGPLTFYEGQYQDTPLHDVLPVELPAFGEVTTGWLDVEFEPNVAELKSHPITSFLTKSPNPASALPPTMSGLNVIKGVRPNAQIIMSATSDEFEKSSNPLGVVGEYRDGRALTMLTHSMWRWDLQSMDQNQLQNRHYYEFWDRSIRWLIKDPSLSSLQVQCKKLFFTPQEKPSIKVVRGDNRNGFNKNNLEISIENLSLNSKRFIEGTTFDENEMSHQFESMTPGQYRVVAKHQEESSECLFNVGHSTQEFKIADPNQESLRELSKATGGKHMVNPKEFPEDLDFLPPKQTRVTAIKNRVLWNTPLILIGLLFCLGLDWLLRFKSGSL